MVRHSSYANLGGIPGVGGKKTFLVTMFTGFIIGIVSTFVFLLNTPNFKELQITPVWSESYDMSRYGDPHSHVDLDRGPKIQGEVSQHSPHEDFHKDEDLVANELTRRVRVLCWVMTSPTNHETKAQHVKATWGKRCNTLIFISSVNDSSLGAVALDVKEDHDLLWAKTKGAFSYIYHHHRDQYDWVLKADDDTFVIVENLRYMLYNYNTSEPIYFGCRFKPYVKQGYMSGGAGYVLSREAVHRFVTQGLPDSNNCHPGEGGAEDVELGKCLEKVGVLAMDSRDQYQRGRFFPFTPVDHLLAHYDPKYWYWNYIYYNTTDGINCCSDLAVTFHYIAAQEMYVFEYLIYHLRPFGIQHQDRPILLEGKTTSS